MFSSAFTYEALLAYTDGETARWHEWFRANPAALDIPYGEGRFATVGHLIIHIFAVELRYAQRLLDLEVTSYDDITIASNQLEDIFALGERSRALLRDFLETATAEDMAVVLTFPTLTAGTVTGTKHKVASNTFLHAIRHWGQIATVLRQAGFSGAWHHDFLLSPVEM